MHIAWQKEKIRVPLFPFPSPPFSTILPSSKSVHALCECTQWHSDSTDRDVFFFPFLLSLPFHAVICPAEKRQKRMKMAFFFFFSLSFFFPLTSPPPPPPHPVLASAEQHERRCFSFFFFSLFSSLPPFRSLTPA